MGTEGDPFPSGAESLASSLAGEIERLRYQLAKLVVGANQGAAGYKWYLRPIEGPRPTLLVNGSVEKWSGGTTVAPDNWTLGGAGATVARNSTAGQFKIGSYAVDVTRSGTDTNLSQTITTPHVLPLHSVGYTQGRVYTLGAWVRATVASRCRVALFDGVAATGSVFHTGGSAFEFLTATRTVSGSATSLGAFLDVLDGNTTCQFDGVTLVEGYLAPTVTAHPADLITAVRVWNSANQSIGDATLTDLSFDTERYDTSDFHGAAACPAANDKCRLYVPAAGLYQMTCGVEWAGNATGERLVRLVTSAGTNIGQTARATPGGTIAVSHRVTAEYRFAAGEYAKCAVFQSSGGALNANAASDYAPTFMMRWVGP
jgi:hypothetical protein